MSDIILLEGRDGVGVITLNRPDCLNALDGPMHGALDEPYVAAHSDKVVSAIVLTGTGRCFCVGTDLGRLARLIDSRGAGYELPRPGILSPAYEGLGLDPDLATTYAFPLTGPKPVIAAIKGACTGIALAIAACCDVRIASSAARSVRCFLSGAFQPKSGSPGFCRASWGGGSPAIC